MPGAGVPAAAVLAGRDPGQDLQAPAPGRPPTSGPAPVTRRSGSSIRGERVCRTGNKRLEHAMFLSAFASLTDPVSRTYYQRKRDQGKRLGPGPARPGPPPHPHPARHDPRRSPLRPATSHETTRSRLTHHIGAPPRFPRGPGAESGGVGGWVGRPPPRGAAGAPRLPRVLGGRLWGGGAAPNPPERHFPPPSSPRRTGCEPAETHGTPGTGSDGGLSKSVAKALRAGIDREEKRGIPTILFAPPGAIGAFATDLDNGRANGTRNGRRLAERGPAEARGQTPRNSIMAGSSRRACTSPAS